MTSEPTLKTLGASGLERFDGLRGEAAQAIAERLCVEQEAAYAQLAAGGVAASREDLAQHLEFLRAVLEFGTVEPMVDCMLWLESVLAARSVPSGHLGKTLDHLAEFFRARLPETDAKVVTSALAAVRNGFLAKSGTPPAPPVAPPAWAAADAFCSALLAGNQRQALGVMNGCLDEGRSLVDFELHVVQPALYRIGELWQANRVTVAQEHMATAMVHAVMTAGLLRSSLPDPVDKRVLLACVEGNHHAVGLRIVADAFQMAGCDVQFLGADVPTRALLQQVAEFKPDLVGLSASFPHHLAAVCDAITQLAARFGESRPAVMIGGLAINRFDSLSATLGADAISTDPATIVECGMRAIERRATS